LFTAAITDHFREVSLVTIGWKGLLIKSSFTK
jgi:hypothetical protein